MHRAEVFDVEHASNPGFGRPPFRLRTTRTSHPGGLVGLYPCRFPGPPPVVPPLATARCSPSRPHRRPSAVLHEVAPPLPYPGVDLVRDLTLPRLAGELPIEFSD